MRRGNQVKWSFLLFLVGKWQWLSRKSWATAIKQWLVMHRREALPTSPSCLKSLLPSPFLQFGSQTRSAGHPQHFPAGQLSNAVSLQWCSLHSLNASGPHPLPLPLLCPLSSYPGHQLTSQPSAYFQGTETCHFPSQPTSTGLLPSVASIMPESSCMFSPQWDREPHAEAGVKPQEPEGIHLYPAPQPALVPCSLLLPSHFRGSSLALPHPGPWLRPLPTAQTFGSPFVIWVTPEGIAQCPGLTSSSAAFPELHDRQILWEVSIPEQPIAAASHLGSYLVHAHLSHLPAAQWGQSCVNY